MTPEQEERRGELARQILDAEIYKEAYKNIEDRLIQELAVVEITKERAEYLRTILVAGRKHRKYMEQVLVTGTMAAMEENRKRSLMERILQH